MTDLITLPDCQEDREAMNEYFTIDGVTKTAREFCNSTGLPHEIYLWRRRNKKILGKYAFELPKAVVFRDGKAYTLGMISEEIGVGEKALRDRWNNGARGEKMFATLRAYEVEDTKAQLKYECRQHLRALLRAHRLRAVKMLQHNALGNVDEPLDTAAAVLNAQRFEDAAKGYQTASTGFIWEYAA